LLAQVQIGHWSLVISHWSLKIKFCQEIRNYCKNNCWLSDFPLLKCNIAKKAKDGKRKSNAAGGEADKMRWKVRYKS
jgi:hypothetical protein